MCWTPEPVAELSIVPETWKKRPYIKGDMNYWSQRKENLILEKQQRTENAENICLPEGVSLE